MEYRHTLYLDDDETVAHLLVTVTPLDGGHDGLTLGYWEVTDLEQHGEHTLSLPEDAHTLTHWQASHSIELTGELEDWLATLNPFDVASDHSREAGERVMEDRADWDRVEGGWK